MLWTQIESSLLARSAMPLYTDSRRVYHNLAHLQRMFAWAEHLGMVYCPVLDEAVWSHDAILDPMGQNELRSKSWLLAINPQATQAADLVMTTVKHGPSSDNRLAMLDLADFLDDDQTQTNTKLLVEEAKRMSGADEAQINHGILGYLTGLEERIRTGVQDGGYGDDTNTFKAINHGVRKTISRLS